jgi:predicted double-glycine peptidase
MSNRGSTKNNSPRRSALWGVSLILGFAFSAVQAGQVWLPEGSGMSSSVGIQSITEKKFAQVVRQQYDFSCGSAALATLLTYHYEDPTDEATTFRKMFAKGDQQKIQRAGFSLLDMKGYLESFGYQAEGYSADLDTLSKAGVPAITLLDVNGYRHFVVVKGVANDEVLVGDPALGLKYFSREKFEEMWDNGILFIITNRPDTGKKHFNKSREWNSLARAPIGKGISREGLSDLIISVPRLGEF